MVAYVVEARDEVNIAAGSKIDGQDFMSPFCWEHDGTVYMMLRVVPKSGKPTGVIWGAKSTDGLNFEVFDKPAISPGPDANDAAGVEDPTVVRHGGGEEYVVFYTGVEENGQGQLLVAEGQHPNDVHKSAALLKAPEGEGNIKEATVAKAGPDDWVLYYEYAQDSASRIGCARGPTDKGPWKVVDDPFGIREGGWDRWHLSTGPIEQLPGCEPVMFYNGATEDARWRIGWVTFSPDYRQVLERGVEPMIMPAPPKDRAATDIAFAASSIVKDGLIHLYYSIEDRLLRRAIIRRYD